MSDANSAAEGAKAIGVLVGGLVGALVVLGIFLRQQGSPESKDVATPTWENEP